jgi:hypothetical protein
MKSIERSPLIRLKPISAYEFLAADSGKPSAPELSIANVN